MADPPSSPPTHGSAFALDPIWAFVFAIVLVLLNGFFVAAEFALVKVRATQLDPHVQAGERRGKVARHMVRHLDAYLSATQLGITLASLALGWIGHGAFSWIVEPVVRLFAGDNPALANSAALTLSFLAITVLHIVLGELAPKSLAIRKPESTSLTVALPLYIFYKATYPMIWLLNHAANGLLRLVRIQPVSEGELAHDEGELRLLLAGGGGAHLSDQKRELLDNVFELSHRVARQIMVPRADVVYLSTTRSLEENLKITRESGHTRFPLCEGDLDHTVGVIHIKDIFRADPLPADLRQIAREMAFVPDTLGLDRLLKRMRTERFHMAAVMDEYGGVSGVVTLETVIEEIVGQISDEFDAPEMPELVPGEEGVWEVSGGMLVVELEEALGIEFSERDEDTIGGVVLSELGRLPVPGDRVEVGPLEIEVLEVRLNRIVSLRVHVKQPAAVAGEG
ncbi:MAG TPA: hemolysin family protein [Thermoanaerobaculia bacterium]|nr:hemolysin family protein [Thermoanaerobaculia bacterium]